MKRPKNADMILVVANQFDRLRIEQPSAVTADLESWLSLKLSMTASQATKAAEWVRSEVREAQ